jgi:hypothetical protein
VNPIYYDGWQIKLEKTEHGRYIGRISKQIGNEHFRNSLGPIEYEVGGLTRFEDEALDVCEEIIRKIHARMALVPVQIITEVVHKIGDENS